MLFFINLGGRDQEHVQWTSTLPTSRFLLTQSYLAHAVRRTQWWRHLLKATDGFVSLVGSARNQICHRSSEGLAAAVSLSRSLAQKENWRNFCKSSLSRALASAAAAGLNVVDCSNFCTSEGRGRDNDSQFRILSPSEEDSAEVRRKLGTARRGRCTH